jgi:hypothetical protein
LSNASRHRIKIRSRSPFLTAFTVAYASSFLLCLADCRLFSYGDKHDETDKPDPAEKKFIDDAIAAERAAGKKLNQPNRHIVLNRARAQIESQRYADRQRALREDERQQSDFAWSRPRAPRR